MIVGATELGELFGDEMGVVKATGANVLADGGEGDDRYGAIKMGNGLV